jgi:major membrane immunogen (membrane-anchored lipoprotein)
MTNQCFPKGAAAAGAAVLLLLSGCAADFDATRPLADGVFQAISKTDEDGAVGQLSVTVSGGVVTNASFTMVQRDGTVKGDNYGKNSDGTVVSAEYYQKAQVAVRACEVYARQLVAVGDPGEVDVVAGATWAHGQFVEAAKMALRESQDKAANK